MQFGIYGLQCLVLIQIILIEGETASNYRDGIKASYIAGATTEITELDQAIDGPWTPELARLATLGYL